MHKHPKNCNCQINIFRLIDHIDCKEYDKQRMKVCLVKKENEALRIGGKISDAKMEWIK